MCVSFTCSIMIDDSKTLVLDEMWHAKRRFGAKAGRSLDEEAIQP